MIRLKNLSLRRSTQLLLKDVSLDIHDRHKIGIIGPNGCGKTSFFRLLCDRGPVDAGELEIPNHWTIAHVEQETPRVSTSAVDYVIQGDRELAELEKALEQALEDNDGMKIANIHEKIATIDGYTAHSRAAGMLHGLGFHVVDMNKPVSAFSGGWCVRLNIARALMCRSQLLLLDEPTNHLDLDAVIWLEKWLNAYTGTLLLISHDRDFLNQTIDHIIHVENQQLNFYKGNYDRFEEQRDSKLALQQSAYEKQERARAHMQSFIDRFKAKASKAKQAQSRMKALEKLPQLSAIQSRSEFHIEFYPPKASGNPLLALDRIDLGYDGNIILNKVSFSLNPGTRLGLLGVNGAGKSTLMTFLAGQLPALGGSSVAHPKLEIGYFAQHQLEYLDLAATPFLHLHRLDPKLSEQQIRTYLGRFAFDHNKAFQLVGSLSGGEKARLALSMIIYQRPNLLLLDEPTNHLDIDIRAALSLALQEYEGAVVLVSHDRHLLRTTADEFLLVAHGKVTPFDGDLADYERWVQEFRRDLPKELTKSSDTPASIKKSSLDQLKKLEIQLAQINEHLKQLEHQLADPLLYQNGADPKQVEMILADQKESRIKQETIEAQWLRLCEELG